MLRIIRRTLGVLAFLAITLMLLDFTGCLHGWLGWLSKIQFLPAVLAVNVVVIVVLVALTLIFGRIYCSVICPLGVFQDLVSWIHGRRKKNRFSYSPAKNWLRYTMLAVMIVAIIAGIGVIVALLAPYGSYGRMVNNLFQPIYIWVNNIIASIAERYESYAFYRVDVWVKSLPVFLVTAGTFILVVVLAWRGGRTYCNTICPVGTLLGFLSRFSLLKVRIDEDKCVNCGLCGKNCKASCIDTKNHKIDYSRCVACGNCINKCSANAISYSIAKKKVAQQEPAAEKSNEPQSPTRRAFLVGTAIVGSEIALAQANKKVDGGLAIIKPKSKSPRTTPLLPPGAGSASNFASHCVGCQLCVSQCPNGVLRPSSDLSTLMQPVMSYERGFCRPECTICSQVCPTGAIKPITPEDKSSIRIGHAVWRRDHCLVLTQGVPCGNCARHCPVGAIEMVPSDPDDDESPFIPIVNTERCIGCGSCEYMCPGNSEGDESHRHTAIYVEGHEMHSLL